MPHLLTRAARRVGERITTIRRRRLYPWIPWWAEVRRESAVHPHVSDEHADWFEAYNTGSTEFEVLNWLYATIRVLKPAAVLETGACDGLGTIALASACAANGRGTVHSVEIDPDQCDIVRRRVAGAGLTAYARVHCESSLDFLAATDEQFDIGFFDSLDTLRPQEFRICLERELLRQVAVFHDTSPRRAESFTGWSDADTHTRYRESLFALAQDHRCVGFLESPLSRGFIAIFVAPRAGRA